MIYSVYWNEERVTVVDAPGAEAVEALILRHQCDHDNCAHCDLFSFAEGVDDDGMKPQRVTDKGYARVSLPAWGVLLLFPLLYIGVFFLYRRVFPQEPHAYWPIHP